jgi:hypothetical protein
MLRQHAWFLTTSTLGQAAYIIGGERFAVKPGGWDGRVTAAIWG